MMIHLMCQSCGIIHIVKTWSLWILSSTGQALFYYLQDRNKKVFFSSIDKQRALCWWKQNSEQLLEEECEGELGNGMAEGGMLWLWGERWGRSLAQYDSTARPQASDRRWSKWHHESWKQLFWEKRVVNVLDHLTLLSLSYSGIN